jgi:hypothetical protein
VAQSICIYKKIKKFLKVRCAYCMGEKGNCCGILMGKPEDRRPLGGPRSRWEDDIKMDLKETGWNAVGKVVRVLN